MATAKKPTSLKPSKPVKAAKPVKAVKAVKAVKDGNTSKASAATEKVKTALAVTPAKAAKAAKSAKPAKPPVVKWKPQKFVVSHLQPSDFKAGLRSYAHYRDLGVAEATGGAVQAHVIRLLGKCDPSVVAIEHYHGVQFQLVYLLKGWMIGEYEGQGQIKMKAGSCWIQPNGIRHTVLDYSPDCEMVEIILPGDFKTVTLG